METSRSHVLPRAALLVLALAGFRTLSSFSFWTHLAVGRSTLQTGIPHTDTLTFTIAGEPWVNTNWLYDILVYLGWSVGGSPLIILLHTALAVLAFGFMYLLVTRKATPMGVALAALLSTWVLAPVFQPSPAVFCLVFPAAFLLVTERMHSFRAMVGVLLLLQWFWTQLHPSFLVGPLLVLFRAFEDLGRKKNGIPKASSTAWGAAVIGVGAVTLLNPYGLHLYRGVAMSIASVASRYALPWISPFSWQFDQGLFAHAVTTALVVGAGGIVAIRGRLPVAITSSAVLGAALAVLRPQMHQALFAVLFFPFLAMSFSSGIEWVTSRLRPGMATWANRVVTGVAWFLLLLSGASFLSSQYYARTGSASAFGLGVENALFPEAASEVIEHPDFPERAVNLAPDGGYLAWRHPDRRVFLDTRDALFGVGGYRELAAALAQESTYLDKFEERWEPGAFVINCTFHRAGRAVRSLMATGRWALVYFDGTTAILVRTIDAYAALLNNPGVQAVGLQVLERERQAYDEKAGGLLSPPNSPRLIGAASVFLDLEKYPEALSVHVPLAKGSRTMASAWVGLGYTQYQLGQFADATRTLRYATRKFPKDLKGWLWLSRVFAADGKMDEARTAHDHAFRMNPGLTQQFDRTVRPGPGAQSPTTRTR